MTIIDKIPNFFLERATQAILDESSQASGEARTVVGLQVGGVDPFDDEITDTPITHLT